MSAEIRRRIARRALEELPAAGVVNLGVGIPTVIATLPEACGRIFIHSENGILGVGPRPPEDAVDPTLVDAGKRPITASPGAAYFDSALSFAMIRGGHIDVAVLGALQIDARGRIANWAIPGQPILGVGGAMDLLCGARRVVVTMTHLSSAGEPKIVPELTLPIGSLRPVDVIVSDYGVLDVSGGVLVLRELAPGITLERFTEATAALFKVGVSTNR
ncbi:3-oxoacid CoA-transferase subunit B [bacterium]|nr:MAG: 3-oxoacid CoA-transferase subunit B [bacterium]